MKLSKEYTIGLAVLLSVLILILGINFLKGKSLFAHDDEYIVNYHKIDRLNVGSGVYMRGFKIGIVKDIHFEGETAEIIKVTILINEKVKFAVDSKAKIFSKDLMGTRGIEIIAGKSKKYKKNGDLFEGIVEGDFKDEFGRQIAPLKNKAERILVSIDTILYTIQQIVNEDTRSEIEHSLKSIGTTLHSLENASKSLEDVVVGESNSMKNIINNVESISGNLKNNNKKISNVINNLSAFSDTLISQDVYASIKDIGQSIKKLKSITAKLDGDKGTMGAIINNRELYNNLNEAVANLNKLVVNIEKNPKKYIKFSVVDFGGKAKSKEIFAVVLISSDKRIDKSDYLNKMEELFYKRKYLYIDKKFKKERKAKVYLKSIKSSYPDAFITRIIE